jgi:hypothetical protein
MELLNACRKARRMSLAAALIAIGAAGVHQHVRSLPSLRADQPPHAVTLLLGAHVPIDSRAHRPRLTPPLHCIKPVQLSPACQNRHACTTGGIHRIRVRFAAAKYVIGPFPPCCTTSTVKDIHRDIKPEKPAPRCHPWQPQAAGLGLSIVSEENPVTRVGTGPWSLRCVSGSQRRRSHGTRLHRNVHKFTP